MTKCSKPWRKSTTGFRNTATGTLVPIFSSLSIPEETVKYLTRKKIFAMAMKDDTMEIVNFEKVNPES